MCNPDGVGYVMVRRRVRRGWRKIHDEELDQL